MLSINNEIRKERIKRGILIRELASRMQIDPSVLSKIERGDRPLTRDIIVKITSSENLARRDLLILWFEEQIKKIILNEEEGFIAIQKIINEKVLKKM